MAASTMLKTPKRAKAPRTCIGATPNRESDKVAMPATVLVRTPAVSMHSCNERGKSAVVETIPVAPEVARICLGSK